MMSARKFLPVLSMVCTVLSVSAISCGDTPQDSDTLDPTDVLTPDAAGDAADAQSPDSVVAADASDAVAPDAGDESVYQDVIIPHLAVDPAAVDFGFGAQNTPKMAQITLTNDGHSDLSIEKLEIINPSTTEFGQEFAIVGNPEFGPTTMPAPVAAIIAPGESVVVELTFTNKGPDAGEVSATLVITTHAPGQGTVEVPLTATRSSEPQCRLQLVPAFGNFGTVAVGFDATRSMRLVNTGTGICKVTSAKVVACPADVDGEPVCPVDIDGVASGVFEIVTEFEQLAVPIQAGAQREFQVRYTPSAETTGVGPAGQVWAQIRFQVKDAFTDVVSMLPSCDGSCEPNLLGYGGVGQASTIPDALDFGTATPGCDAVERVVCVYNTGIVPVTLENVSIAACSDEFGLTEVLEMPEYILAGDNTCFGVSYLPTGAGKDDCVMQITVNGAVDPLISIPMSAGGVAETAQVDEFVQQRSDAVDVLFVIDDSGSMCDDQVTLLASFETFIERARIWNNDFHVGVINVDVENEAVAGRLNRGDTTGPRYLTPSPDILTQFPALAGIGCDGDSSIESGLHATLTALMPPLTTDTTVECETDADCTGNPIICPDGLDCPYACVDTTCAGFNKGFLRDDARLEVIVLSDEDDQSVLPVDDYVSMLKDLKAARGEGMVHLNAIVGITGVPLPGDEYSDCSSSSGAWAMAGTRYIAAADATGGIVGSICEESFDEAMLSISEHAFTDGGSLKYFLSRPADSSTVVVAIRESTSATYVNCTGGWQYDAEGGYVILDPSGTCIPEPGDTIRVSYDVPCVQD